MHRSIYSILILGDGLLASELINTGYEYVSRKKTGFDITRVDEYENIFSQYRTIINCIANTNTYSHDVDHWNVNYKFVIDLVDYCVKTDKRLVHVSTGYVYSNNTNNPTEEDIPAFQSTLYSYTKLLADEYIKIKMKDYLIVRSVHKPKPFPYECAYVDHFGNFCYVDEVANFISHAQDLGLKGVYNVGKKASSMFDLAAETSEVKPANKPAKIPSTVYFNCDKYRSIYK